MQCYDAVVWRGALSDGSICYAAVCPAVNHAHGQGDTEAAALADAADTIALFLEHIPYDFVKTGQAAADELAELLDDLALEGITTWMRQVAAQRNLVPA